MPAKSKAQQRLFGMVHAYQKGKLKHAPAKVREIARHISSDDAKHFAETSHRGLPERKREDEEEKAASFAGFGARRQIMTPYERGFFTKCAQAGLTTGQAMDLMRYYQVLAGQGVPGIDRGKRPVPRPATPQSQVVQHANGSMLAPSANGGVFPQKPIANPLAWTVNQGGSARNTGVNGAYSFQGHTSAHNRVPETVTAATTTPQLSATPRPIRRRPTFNEWSENHPDMENLPFSEQHRAYMRSIGKNDWGAWLDDIGSSYQTKSQSLDDIIRRRDAIAAEHGIKINGDGGDGDAPGNWFTRFKDRMTMSRPEFHRVYADKANKQLQQALAASGRANALNNRVGLGLPNTSTAAPKSTPTPKASPAPAKTPSTAPSVNLSF